MKMNLDRTISVMNIEEKNKILNIPKGYCEVVIRRTGDT